MSDFDLTRYPPVLTWTSPIEPEAEPGPAQDEARDDLAADSTDATATPRAIVSTPRPEPAAQQASPAPDDPGPSRFTALAGPPLQAGKALLQAAERYVTHTPPQQMAADGARLTMRGFLLMLATIPSDAPQEERDRWATTAPRHDTPEPAPARPEPPPSEVMTPRLEDLARVMWLQRLGAEGTGFIASQHQTPIDPLAAVAQAGKRPPRRPADTSGEAAADASSRTRRKPDDATPEPTPERAPDAEPVAGADAAQATGGRDEAKVRRMLDAVKPFDDDAQPSTTEVAHRILDAAVAAGMDAHDGLPYVDELKQALNTTRGRTFSAVTMLRESGAFELYRLPNGLLFARAPQLATGTAALGGGALVPSGELSAASFEAVDKSRAHRRGDMQALTTLQLLRAAEREGATPHRLMPPMADMQSNLGVSAATIRQAMKQAGAHGLHIESRPVVSADGQVRPRFVIAAIDDKPRLTSAIATLDASLPAAGDAPRGDFTATATSASKLRAFKPVPREVDGDGGAYGQRIAANLFAGLVKAGYKKNDVAPTSGELSEQMQVRAAQIRPAFALLEPYGVKVSAYVFKGDTASHYRLVIDEMPQGNRAALIRQVTESLLTPPVKAAPSHDVSRLEPVQARGEATHGRTASFAARNLYRWMVEEKVQPGWTFPSVTQLSKQLEISPDNTRQGLMKLSNIGVHAQHTRGSDGPVRELVRMPANPHAAAVELNRRERFAPSERLVFDKPTRRP